jgi:mannose-6-phosphate isomerase-like protein (cupin superfamily)
MMHINLFQATKDNKSFLKVLYTGKHSQLSLVSLKPGEDVQWGIIKVDKIFIIIAGSGRAVAAGDEQPLQEGEAILIPAGTRHDLVNTGEQELKMALIFAPAIYPEETSLGTREKAILDPFSDLSGV